MFIEFHACRYPLEYRFHVRATAAPIHHILNIVCLAASHSIHGVFSGETKYFIGVNIVREGSMTMDELFVTDLGCMHARCAHRDLTVGTFHSSITLHGGPQ